jgi:hypothetical protein
MGCAPASVVPRGVNDAPRPHHVFAWRLDRFRHHWVCIIGGRRLSGLDRWPVAAVVKLKKGR